MLAAIADVFGAFPAERLTFSDHSRQAGEAGMGRLLELTPDLDGVFVASDVMAAAIAVLQSRGIAVADEIRVSGWNNSVPPDAVKPSLTTLDVPFIQIGRELATLPSQPLAGSPSRRNRGVGTTLIVRESA